jgi:hypothetical protein
MMLCVIQRGSVSSNFHANENKSKPGQRRRRSKASGCNIIRLLHQKTHQRIISPFKHFLRGREKVIYDMRNFGLGINL